MQVGMYVRIPILRDDQDQEFPRSFALGQIKRINQILNTADVILHDVNKTGRYYGELFRLPEPLLLRHLIRAHPPAGARLVTSKGEGIMVSHDDEQGDQYHRYLVKLSDGQYLYFQENTVRADYTALDINPIEMTIRFEFQNPTWFSSRYSVSRLIHTLNNAVYGFRSLAGSRMFLLPHQVTTIIRCLRHRPMRFMLADEVGLGKTVEAASIIKILSAQNVNVKVLYVIPDALVTQWIFELQNKFSIRACRFGEVGNHVVVTPEKLVAIGNDIIEAGWDLVVVDETHHFLGDDVQYEALFQLSNHVNEILLLSATPIQDRRDEFLKLLCILNPKKYQHMSRNEFDGLVSQQLAIEKYLYFLMTNLEEVFSEVAQDLFDDLDSIANLIKDSTFGEMLKFAKSGDQFIQEDGVRQCIAYVSEHFRLEKQIIRNRRVALTEQLSKRNLIELAYLPAGQDVLYGEYDAIESTTKWLDHNKDNPEVDPVLILMALYSSPWALNWSLSQVEAKGVSIDGYLRDSLNSWMAAADWEIVHINRLLDEEPDAIFGRLAKCMDYLDQEIFAGNPNAKLLVFSHFTLTAARFLDMARKRWGHDGCAGFYHGMTNKELNDSALVFQDPTSLCRILVSDELGGEGRNFQMADMIVHLDSPWFPNTLEQRIGRLDRLGREVEKPVISLVLYAQDTIEEQLMRLWRDGLEVYTQSLSGLEIASGDIAQMIKGAVRRDVRQGLKDALPAIQESLVTMKKTVKREQLYDLGALLYRPLNRIIEDMLSAYQGKEDTVFSAAMKSWGAQAGFYEVFDAENDITEFRRDKFSPRSAVNAMVVPPRWDRYDINPLVRRGGGIRGTFNRQVAIEREDLLFYAPGDPIFDAIINNALWSYRGRITAVELPNDDVDYNGLIFTWNIEPGLDPIIDLGLDIVALAEFRAFLPINQIVTLHPVHPRFNHVIPSQVVPLLSRQGLMRHGTYLGKRDGANGIRRFMEENDPDQWAYWVRQEYSQGKDESTRILREKWDLDTAREEIDRIIRADDARRRYFSEATTGAAQVSEFFDAILTALEKSKTKLDSVIFLRTRRTS